MKVFFEITAGLLNRGSVRRQLNNSKEKLKYWYPECHVLLTEDKTLFESRFYFEANDLPDSAKSHMEKWLSDMKKIAEKYQ
jgi:hypothetical protein